MSNPAHSNSSSSAALTKMGGDLRSLTERVTRLEKQNSDLRNHKASHELRITNTEDALSELRSIIDEKLTALFGALESAEALYDRIAEELGLNVDDIEGSDEEEELANEEQGTGEETQELEQLEISWGQEEPEVKTEDDYQVGDLEGEEIG